MQPQRPCRRCFTWHCATVRSGSASDLAGVVGASCISCGWLQKEHSSALSRQGWQARLWVCYRNTSKTLPLPGSLVAACGTSLATIVRCVGASSLAATRLWSYCWCAVCGWLCLQLLLSALWPTFRVPSTLFLRSWSSTRPMLVCKKRARVCCNLWRAMVRMTPWRVALQCGCRGANAGELAQPTIVPQSAPPTPSRALRPLYAVTVWSLCYKLVAAPCGTWLLRMVCAWAGARCQRVRST